MGRLLDKIIVVDVEATCWEGQQPKDQSSEIIEIGICMIDLQSMTIEDNEGILILPQNSVVSDFCTQLTTITQGILEEDGISFQEACEMLRDKYNSKKRVWASYGAYDLNMFQSQCSEMKVEYPFGSSHVNVKTLFSLKRRLTRHVGMSGAL